MWSPHDLIEQRGRDIAEYLGRAPSTPAASFACFEGVWYTMRDGEWVPLRPDPEELLSLGRDPEDV